MSAINRNFCFSLVITALLLQGCSSGGNGGNTPSNPSSSLASSVSSAASVDSSSSVEQSASSAPNFQSGKSAFANNCSSCHSDRGDGTFEGRLIGVAFDVNAFNYPGMDYNGTYSDGSAAELSAFIFDVMGPFSPDLDQFTAFDIAQYLWSLRQTASSTSSSQSSIESSQPSNSSLSSVSSATSSTSSISSVSSSETSSIGSQSSISSILSSTSESSSSSLSSASSSSVEGEEFIRQLSRVSKSVNPDVTNLYELGGFLTGTSRNSYNRFVKEINESPAINWELSRVMNGLTPVLTEVAVKFLNQWVADGALPSNESINVPDGAVVQELFNEQTLESGAIYRLGFTGDVNACSEPWTQATEVHCKVSVDVGVDITAYDLGGTVNPISLSMKNLAVNFTSLEASNGFVTVRANPSLSLGAHLTGGVVSVRAEYSGTLEALGLDSLTLATVTLGNVNFDIPLLVIESGVPQPFEASASISGTLQMRASATPETIQQDGYSITRFPLQLQNPALNIQSDIGLEIAKGQEKISASIDGVQITDSSGGFGVDISLNDCSGEGCPAAFDFELVGESDSTFLGMAADVEVVTELEGEQPIEIHGALNRISDEAIALRDLLVSFEGFSINNLDSDYNSDGDLVSLAVTSPDGISVNLNTVNGVRTGTVVDANNNQLAEIRNNSEGVLTVYFMSGSEIEL